MRIEIAPISSSQIHDSMPGSTGDAGNSGFLALIKDISTRLSSVSDADLGARRPETRDPKVEESVSRDCPCEGNVPGRVGVDRAGSKYNPTRGSEAVVGAGTPAAEDKASRNPEDATQETIAKENVIGTSVEHHSAPEDPSSHTNLNADSNATIPVAAVSEQPELIFTAPTIDVTGGTAIVSRADEPSQTVSQQRQSPATAVVAELRANLDVANTGSSPAASIRAGSSASFEATGVAVSAASSGTTGQSTEFRAGSFDTFISSGVAAAGLDAHQSESALPNSRVVDQIPSSDVPTAERPAVQSVLDNPTFLQQIASGPAAQHEAVLPARALPLVEPHLSVANVDETIGAVRADTIRASSNEESVSATASSPGCPGGEKIVMTDPRQAQLTGLNMELGSRSTTSVAAGASIKSAESRANPDTTSGGSEIAAQKQANQATIGAEHAKAPLETDFVRGTMSREESAVLSQPASNPLSTAESRAMTGPRATEARVFQASDFLEQVADGLRMQIRGDNGEIRIQLKPEALGQLEIKAETGLNGIVARISASSESVKSLLEHNLPVLQQNLQSQGLKIERIEVVIHDGFNPAQTSDQQQSPGGNSGEPSGTTPSDPDIRERTPGAEDSGALIHDGSIFRLLGPNSTFHTIA